MAKKPKRVVVEGYLLDFMIPTEERLSVSLDVTAIATEPKYGRFRTGLEELMEQIDQAHAKRETRGRSLKGRYRLQDVAGKRGERKILRFSPFPSVMANRLRSLRRDWYEALHKYSIILARGKETATGYVRTRCLYMVPKAKAKPLMTVVKRMNKEIDKLNKTLEKYERGKDYTEVRRWVQKMTKLDIGVNHTMIPHIDLGLYEVGMASGIVETYTKGKRKEALKTLQKAREKGLDDIQREVERTKHTMVEQAITDIQGRLGTCLTTLAEATAKKLTARRALTLKKRVGELQNLADSAGVGYFVAEATKNTLTLIDAFEAKDQEKIREAAEIVAKEAGISASKDPLETLKRATIQMTKGVSPRIKAVLDEIL